MDWIQDALDIVVHHLLNLNEVCVSKLTEYLSMEINIRCLYISGLIELRSLL
jgi:hypothetical protein